MEVNRTTKPGTTLLSVLIRKFMNLCIYALMSSAPMILAVFSGFLVPERRFGDGNDASDLVVNN